jgi:uncharacterized protein YukE
MADVTTTFAAKDESFAKTVDNLGKRLDGFQGQTQSFSEKVGSMASSFASLAAPLAGIAAAFFGARAAVKAFNDAIRIGGELNDLAARTGETAGELAVLQRAFENAGMSGGEVGAMLNRLQKFMGQASEGGNEQAAALARLGLSYDELKSKSPSEQMQEFAQRIKQIEDPTIRAQVAMEIFGRSGGAMLPLLRAMGSELDVARAQLGGWPAALDATNQALDTIGDNFNAISNKGVEFATGLMTKLAPALADITTKISQIDAAGLGMALAEYFDRFMKAAAGAFRLGEAIDSVKLAIEALSSGNVGQGLELMWVTMRNTALNAINEIARNFTAALQTVGEFLVKMFDKSGALVMSIQTVFRVAANYLKESLYSAMADFMQGIGKMGMAKTFRYESETARRAIEMDLFSIGSQIEEVANQAAEAGAAMPKAFADNKAALDPLFDLTDEYAEQQQLLVEMAASLGKQHAAARGTADASAEFAEALKSANESLEGSQILTEKIALDLLKASISAQGIAPAFSLAEGSSGNIAADLNNTGESSQAAAEWLSEGADSAGRIASGGSQLAADGAAFAESVGNASVNANVTAANFSGMADRMGLATNQTSAMLDKMREAFHFGARTEETTSNMRQKENTARLEENKRDRAHERADRLEANGQQKAAHNLRMRADENYTRAMEKLSQELKEGTDSAREALKDGGKVAGEAIKEAVSPLKDDDDKREKPALEETLKKCADYLKSLDEKLPQNALT